MASRALWDQRVLQRLKITSRTQGSNSAQAKLSVRDILDESSPCLPVFPSLRGCSELRNLADSVLVEMLEPFRGSCMKKLTVTSRLRPICHATSVSEDSELVVGPGRKVGIGNSVGELHSGPPGGVRGHLP